MKELDMGLPVIRVMKQIMGMLRQNVDCEFKELNLTTPQGMLLGVLSRFDRMKVSELSRELGLSNSTVSGIIDRLEKQGYIERNRSEEDRRVVYVSVTEKYKKGVQEHFEKMKYKFKTMMDNATPEEFDKIIDGLNTLKTVMERQQQ